MDYGSLTEMSKKLGCVGSRSKINFGVSVDLAVGALRFPTYFDVVNLDHYDMVIGIPFMRANGVHLDFTSDTVRFGSTSVSTLEGEGKWTRLTKPARSSNSRPRTQALAQRPRAE